MLQSLLINRFDHLGGLKSGGGGGGLRGLISFYFGKWRGVIREGIYLMGEGECLTEDLQ